MDMVNNRTSNYNMSISSPSENSIWLMESINTDDFQKVKNLPKKKGKSEVNNYNILSNFFIY
jgi:hypothetical protein